MTTAMYGSVTPVMWAVQVLAFLAERPCLTTPFGGSSLVLSLMGIEWHRPTFPMEGRCPVSRF